MKIAALLVALALALGTGAAAWWNAAPREDSPEVAFARDMAAHHAQAVAMSLTVQKRARDERLRLLATDVILTQQAQIGQMQGWLAAWRRPLSGARPPLAGMGRAAMGLATGGQVRALETLPVKNAQTQYLRLMIAHHQGGIMMASGVLAKTRREEVRRLARAIVQSQRSEIQAMRDLLRAGGNAGGEAAAPDASPPSAMPGAHH